MLLRLRRLLRKFDAALIVACFMLAMTGGVAMAEEVNLFLNKYEPPSGGGQGLTAYNNHVWGWAWEGSACIHEYIVITKSWTSPHCALERNAGVNNYPETSSTPGAWNNPELWRGEHKTQGKQWYI